MSSSPRNKRSIKPSPIAAGASHFPITGDPSHLQSLSAATNTYGPYVPQPPALGHSRKRRYSGAQMHSAIEPASVAPSMASYADPAATPGGLLPLPAFAELPMDPLPLPPAPKKGRTNTPWTPAEEQRLKQMRDAGNSWSEIAKSFPQRTEGSVKKHWYKDMHYAEFALDEEAALLAAIKEYEANKWKEIGKRVGKPAKACEQYAKEHFQGKI